MNEEKASLNATLGRAFVAAFGRSHELGGGRITTSLRIDQSLDPADTFGDPIGVVEDCDLKTHEKQAVLSNDRKSTLSKSG